MSFGVSESRGYDWKFGAGFSDAFAKLQEAARESRVHASEPLSLGWKRYLRDRALELGSTRSKEGWDGYDANPISSEAVARTLLLIDLMPEWVPYPELAPSPEGEISFEWYSSREQILSVTPQKGLLVYAAVLGSDHTQYGKVPLLDSWPTDILSILSKHFDYVGHPSFSR
jgi:hypothetical protein